MPELRAEQGGANVKKPITISGLGQVSRHKACQIAICDEAGAEQVFTPARLTSAPDLKGFSGKEIANAMDALVRCGTVKRFTPGSYGWL